MPLNHVQSSSDHENATVAGLVIPVPGCGMVHGSDQACVWDAGQWRRVRCADRSGSARAQVRVMVSEGGRICTQILIPAHTHSHTRAPETSSDNGGRGGEVCEGLCACASEVF